MVAVTETDPAARPVKALAWPLNIETAAACAVALVCVIILGVSAASAAASAAALRRVRSCAASPKSTAKPTANKMTGTAIA